MRIALGFGRGPRAKILPWFFIGVLAAIAMVMALVAGAAERLAGPGAAQQMNLPSHGDFYGIASIIMFVFGALVAPECSAATAARRDQSVSRAADDRVGYVLSRWTAFLPS